MGDAVRGCETAVLRQRLILRTTHRSIGGEHRYVDQDGNAWSRFDKGGYLDVSACDECGREVGEDVQCAYVLMDGGQCWCDDCFKKVFEVDFVDGAYHRCRVCDKVVEHDRFKDDEDIMRILAKKVMCFDCCRTGFVDWLRG